MKRFKQFLLLVSITAILSACGQVSVDPGASEANEQDSAPEIQEAPPAEVVSDRSGDLIPDGVLISTGDENSLTFVDENGIFMRKIETPGIIAIDPEDVAITGPIVPDGPFPPVVYHQWTPNQALMVNDKGDISTARASDTFLALAGAPGQDAIAFSEIMLNNENNPHGFLYAAKTDDLGSAAAFFDLVDQPFYWALKPVSVETLSGKTQGVWYAKTAWGIGGVDLIFPINRGLYYFDLTNGDNKLVLDDEHSLQGISPSLNFAASVQAGNIESAALSITKLSNGQSTQYPLDPDTDRGAGWAVFSPDDGYVAWLEASGSMVSDPYDFQSRVRVGDAAAGGVIQSVDDLTVKQVIGSSKVTMLRPAGWLDNKTLLIEARGEDWEDVSLLRFEVTSGTLSEFCEGSFLSFGYQ